MSKFLLFAAFFSKKNDIESDIDLWDQAYQIYLDILKTRGCHGHPNLQLSDM